MGKMFAILLIVAAVWAGLEYYTEGSEGAFGGAFSSASREERTAGARSADDPMAQPSSPARLMGKMVDRAHRATEQNYQRMLEHEEKLFGD